ncbi:MAG: hypothetical protein J5784_03960 [Muribaculaceae bacterium]|nr:hypothetical protein [Muribaculaceae bacterium]
MNYKLFLPLLAVGMTFSAMSAQNYEQPMTKPSVYMILVKSDKENAKLDYEIENPNLILKRFNEIKNQFKDFLAPGKNIIDIIPLGKKNKKEDTELTKELDKSNGIDKTTIRSNVPQSIFPTIPIPDKFFDHNLKVRVVDLDPLTKGLSTDEIDKANEPFAKTDASKISNLFGGLIGIDKSQSFIANIDTISRLIPAALGKHFKEQHTSELLLAKWLNYKETKAKQANTASKTKKTKKGKNTKASSQSSDNVADAVIPARWDENLITERGLYSLTEEEKEKALKTAGTTAILAGRGYDLIGKTFVVAINLRYRSNKAFMLEANDEANAIISAINEIGGKIAGPKIDKIVRTAFLGKEITALVASKALTGYRVQATAFLYKIDWTDEISYEFATQIVDKNASLEDLIQLGICRLIPMGKSKGVANLNKVFLKEITGVDKRSEKDLVSDATQRAIEKAITQLQEKFEDFRTYTHITGVGDKGLVYAKIGTKEGVEEGDKYEICESTLNDDGRITYKPIKTVEAEKDNIWENKVDVSDPLFNGLSDEEAKNLGVNKKAVSLGQTTFKGAKKGEDYTGYLLRLKSKKKKK